jgi:hypothetical protein
MFAVKGFYNGDSVVVNEPIPVKEQYDVIITFISSIKESNLHNQSREDDRKKSFDFLMDFPKKSLPENFDYKKELIEALDEKYHSVD